MCPQVDNHATASQVSVLIPVIVATFAAVRFCSYIVLYPRVPLDVSDVALRRCDQHGSGRALFDSAAKLYVHILLAKVATKTDRSMHESDMYLQTRSSLKTLLIEALVRVMWTLTAGDDSVGLLVERC